jgi:hypothetical protein
MLTNKHHWGAGPTLYLVIARVVPNNVSPRHDWKEAAKDQAVHQHDAQPTLDWRYGGSVPRLKKMGMLQAKKHG